MIKNLFLVGILPCFVLISCIPDTPYSGQHVVNIIPAGGGPARSYEPPCCVTIDCDPNLSGCQAAVDAWGAFCADFGVCVTRAQVDTVYDYYSRNDMNTYYSRYDINEIFPELARSRPTAKDSLVNGNYKLYVISDSSIVIVKSPIDSVGLENIIFAFKRDDISVDQ